ncbi:MAG TPA: envelope stress response membrane protein PspB [Acetobacteraceae bacterium]|jgi:phage shock protein B|nr:envelope stress response membrane protein PspB [Acetobacteraceae bacterium]
MSVPAGLVAVLFLVVVAPIWIVAHYATRWRTARMMSREQERVLADLWELAQGMEQRVESLESILDAEAPGWRGRAQAGVRDAEAEERWNRADPWMEARR